jgi:hypothetical protein
MTTKKYPLDPLLKVREAEVDKASRALGKAVREREGAERRKRVADEEERRAKEGARAIEEAERAKLDKGELKVADLARADAWGVADAARQEGLAHARRMADDALVAARTSERAAQGETATRKADAQVIEQDRANWSNRERRAAEARAEEEAAEVWRPRHG